MSSARHRGYNDCSQPNSGLSVIGGKALREVLEQVVVGVDEPRCHEAISGIERLRRAGRRAVANVLDQTVPDRHPSAVELGAFVVHRGHGSARYG